MQHHCCTRLRQAASSTQLIVLSITHELIRYRDNVYNNPSCGSGPAHLPAISNHLVYASAFFPVSWLIDYIWAFRVKN